MTGNTVNGSVRQIFTFHSIYYRDDSFQTMNWTDTKCKNDHLDTYLCNHYRFKLVSTGKQTKSIIQMVILYY